jgi:hypothetical protein
MLTLLGVFASLSARILVSLSLANCDLSSSIPLDDSTFKMAHFVGM